MVACPSIDAIFPPASYIRIDDRRVESPVDECVHKITPDKSRSASNDRFLSHTGILANSRAARRKDDAYRLKENVEIEQERSVAKVVEIVGELRSRLLQICRMMRVAIMLDLCPPGEPRRDEVSCAVVRNTRAVL